MEIAGRHFKNLYSKDKSLQGESNRNTKAMNRYHWYCCKVTDKKK